MRKAFPIAVALGVVLSAVGVAYVMAHEGEPGEETLAVEPSSVTAGDTVVLAGSGLEPDNDRVLLLAGGDIVIEFGTVRTDDEGMFEKELTIPDHLPTGAYELRAIGDETLTVPLAVTAIAGGRETSPGIDDASQTVAARERTPIELAIILVLVAVAAVAGGVLVWRAERFRGRSAA
jgi:hypothetical protein